MKILEPDLHDTILYWVVLEISQLYVQNRWQQQETNAKNCVLWTIAARRVLIVSVQGGDRNIVAK
jgi:hypothetical protein